MGSLGNRTIRQQLFGVLGICVVVIAALAAIGGIQSARLRVLQDEGAGRADAAVAASEAGAMGARAYQVIADAELNLDLAHSRSEWTRVRSDAEADMAACAKAADTTEEKAWTTEAAAAFNSLATQFESQMLPLLASAGTATPEVLAIDARIDG